MSLIKIIMRKSYSKVTKKEANKTILVISIIAAIAMLLASYLLVDTKYVNYSFTITNIFIILWLISYLRLSKIAGEKK